MRNYIRLLIIFSVFITFLVNANAQTNVVNYTKTLEWNYNDNVSHYEIVVEMIYEDGTNIPFNTYSTDKNHFTITFVPGQYRYKIKSFNESNIIQNETEWKYLDINIPEKPVIKAFQPYSIALNDINDSDFFVLSLVSSGLDNKCKIYLSQNKNLIINPEMIKVQKDGKAAKVYFLKNKLKPGSYGIFAETIDGLSCRTGNFSIYRTSEELSNNIGLEPSGFFDVVDNEEGQEDGFNQWQTFTDLEKGGNSVCSIVVGKTIYDGNEYNGIFLTGTASENVPGGAYIGFKSIEGNPLINDLNQANTLSFYTTGDDREYKVTFVVSTGTSVKLYNKIFTSSKVTKQINIAYSEFCTENNESFPIESSSSIQQIRFTTGNNFTGNNQVSFFNITGNNIDYHALEEQKTAKLLADTVDLNIDKSEPKKIPVEKEFKKPSLLDKKCRWGIEGTVSYFNESILLVSLPSLSDINNYYANIALRTGGLNQVFFMFDVGYNLNTSMDGILSVAVCSYPNEVLVSYSGIGCGISLNNFSFSNLSYLGVIYTGIEFFKCIDLRYTLKLNSPTLESLNLIKCYDALSIGYIYHFK